MVANSRSVLPSQRIFLARSATGGWYLKVLIVVEISGTGFFG
jgi:hypothetical protein